MSNAVEMSKIYTELLQIKKDRRSGNLHEDTLARRFFLKCGDMPEKAFFKTMYKVFGPHQTIKWYNKVHYDGKNIVRARKELKALIEK